MVGSSDQAQQVRNKYPPKRWRPVTHATVCAAAQPRRHRRQTYVSEDGEPAVPREPADAEPRRRGGQGGRRPRRDHGLRRWLHRVQGRSHPHLRIFGFEAPNLRKIADKVASSGYFVVVPDFLHGEPYSHENADRPFPAWIKDHAPEKEFEEAKQIVVALKEQGASSVGAAGYCWGAKLVAELAKANEIQAAAMSHPSFVSVDDIKETKCPIAILGAETDNMSPPELVKQFEQILSNSGIGHFVKIYPGVSHGWTVRCNSDDATAVKCAEEAMADMTSWFNENLK